MEKYIYKKDDYFTLQIFHDMEIYIANNLKQIQNRLVLDTSETVLDTILDTYKTKWDKKIYQLYFELMDKFNTNINFLKSSLLFLL